MGSIIVKGQKLHLIAIVSKPLFSICSLHKPHKVEIVCMAVCPYVSSPKPVGTYLWIYY